MPLCTEPKTASLQIKLPSGWLACPSSACPSRKEAGSFLLQALFSHRGGQPGFFSNGPKQKVCFLNELSAGKPPPPFLDLLIIVLICKHQSLKHVQATIYTRYSAIYFAKFFKLQSPSPTSSFISSYLLCWAYPLLDLIPEKESRAFISYDGFLSAGYSGSISRRNAVVSRNSLAREKGVGPPPPNSLPSVCMRCLGLVPRASRLPLGGGEKATVWN